MGRAASGLLEAGERHDSARRGGRPAVLAARGAPPAGGGGGDAEFVHRSEDFGLRRLSSLLAGTPAGVGAVKVSPRSAMSGYRDIGDDAQTAGARVRARARAATTAGARAGSSGNRTAAEDARPGIPLEQEGGPKALTPTGKKVAARAVAQPTPGPRRWAATPRRRSTCRRRWRRTRSSTRRCSPRWPSCARS